MTTNPFADLWTDACTEWQHTFEGPGLGDRQDLEKRWILFLNDCNRVRIDLSNGSPHGHPETDFCRR